MAVESWTVTELQRRKSKLCVTAMIENPSGWAQEGNGQMLDLPERPLTRA